MNLQQIILEDSFKNVLSAKHVLFVVVSSCGSHPSLSRQRDKQVRQCAAVC